MSVPLFPCLRVTALVVSVFAATYFARKHSLQAEQFQPFGRYTSHQIIARTQPLSHLFTTLGNELHLSASKQELWGESIRRYWIVDCTDESGNYVACFTWDADSGELYLAGHRPLRPSGHEVSPLRQVEAVEIARRWMKDLGIARQAPRWKLARSPEQNHHVWHVDWEAEEREAFIQIDFRSGDLLQAKSWRRYRQQSAP
jgi:hypothetical protein